MRELPEGETRGKDDRGGKIMAYDCSFKVLERGLMLDRKRHEDEMLQE